MDIEEKKSALDRLWYEIWMFNEVFFQSNYVCVPANRCSIENNALLESFLIHTRNIFYFFQDKNPKYPDDINYSDFGINKISIDLPSDNSIEKINAFLAHLTQERIKKLKPKWECSKIREEINQKLKIFFDSLPLEIFPTKEDRNKNDFLSLLSKINSLSSVDG